MPAEVELISFELCPYVQRAIIVMTEKQIAHKRTYIDLAHKPDWFAALSPTGKVPVLRVGTDVIFESGVITEFLDETSPGGLHPADPLEKARHRAWIEFASGTLAAIGKFYSAPSGSAFDQARVQLIDRIHSLNGTLVRGPFFAGERFHLVDAAYATLVRYFDAFGEIDDFGFLTAVPKVQAYFAALKQRPSVQGAVLPDYPQRLQGFLRRQGGELSARMTSV